MSKNQGRTRREILTDAAKAAAAASVAGLSGCFPSVGGKWPDADILCSNPDGGATDTQTITPAVVEVFREESLVTGTKTQVHPDVVAAMLDVGLTELARQVKMFTSGSVALDGGGDIIDAGYPEQDSGTDNPWTVLLPNYQVGQSIGIKVNCLGKVATSPALVHAIITSLRDKLGVETKKIIVWDRYLIDITSYGKYTDDDLAGAQVWGNLLRSPEEKNGETEDDPALTDGHGFGDVITCGIPRGIPEVDTGPGHFPRLSRILTHETDYTINCPTFKTHTLSGITGALKSVYGMINIPGEYHINFNEVSSSLYAIPAVRKSIPLTICDAIVGIFSGDASSTSNCTPKRILLAQDPVALDSYMMDYVNQLRVSKGGSSLVLPWLDKAAKLGLGNTNYQLIQV